MKSHDDRFRALLPYSRYAKGFGGVISVALFPRWPMVVNRNQAGFCVPGLVADRRNFGVGCLPIDSRGQTAAVQAVEEGQTGGRVGEPAIA